MNYKPLTDEELAGRGLAGWKHQCLIEQARRANALAEAFLNHHRSVGLDAANTYCAVVAAVRAYLGETND